MQRVGEAADSLGERCEGDLSPFEANSNLTRVETLVTLNDVAEVHRCTILRNLSTGPESGYNNVWRQVFEHDLDGHADFDILARATDDVGRHHRPFFQLD